MARISARNTAAIIVLIVIVVAAGIYGFHISSPGSQTTSVTTVVSTSGGTIVVEESSTPDTLDPAVGWTSGAAEAIQQVYQGLFSYLPNSTEIVPLLANNYTMSSDGLTYTFWLRNNVVFSNGDPLNAYVFWYSLYRCAVMLQSPSYLVTVALNTTGVTASMLNQFNTANNVPPPSLLQVMQNPRNAITVIGPYEFEVHLMFAFPPFLATLTQTMAYAVDPRVISENGGVNASNTSAWMTSNALGTGPFMITQYMPNTVTVFQRNSNYWGGANGIQPTPRLDKVIVKAVPDTLTRLEDVERGSAQASFIDFSMARQLVGKPGVYLPNFGFTPYMQIVAFDTQKFPFNITLVRQAVVHAVNETAVVQQFSGLGSTFVGPNIKGMPGYNYSLQPYSYNVTLAKQLLAQAGYAGGKGLPSVELMVPTDDPPAVEWAPIVQANLADIGITVKIVTTTVSTLTSIIGTQSPKSSSYPDLTSIDWWYFPDPWGYADWLVGPINYGASNVAYYNNTEVNALLARADVTTNQTQRELVYQHVDELVYDDVPYLWMGQFENAYPHGFVVSNAQLAGFVPNTFQFIQLDFSTLYLSS